MDGFRLKFRVVAEGIILWFEGGDGLVRGQTYRMSREALDMLYAAVVESRKLLGELNGIS